MVCKLAYNYATKKQVKLKSIVRAFVLLPLQDLLTRPLQT